MSSPSAKNFLRRTKISPSGEKLAPYLFILPSVLFLGAILGFPILFSIMISFQKYNLETLISKHAEFVGFQNYIAILRNPGFSMALTHSLIFTFFSILFQFTIGLGLEVVVNGPLVPVTVQIGSAPAETFSIKRGMGVSPRFALGLKVSGPSEPIEVAYDDVTYDAR